MNSEEFSSIVKQSSVVDCILTYTGNLALLSYRANNFISMGIILLEDAGRGKWKEGGTSKYQRING